MKIRSVFHNIVLNISYKVLEIIFPLITFPYVYRVLQPEAMGKVSFYSSISQYGIILAGLGISTYGIRAVSSVRDDKEKLSETVKELFIINFILSVIVVGILFAITPFYSKFQQDIALLALNCLFIVSNSIGLSWMFSGLEQFDYITIRSVIFKTLSLIMVFIFVKDVSDYWKYAAITVFSSVGAYVCNYAYSKRFVSFSIKTKLNIKKHIRPMLLLFASSLAINVYSNLDTVMLGVLCGDIQVGLYSMSVKIKSILLIIVYTISTTLLPRMTYYVENNQEDEYINVLKKSTAFVLILSIPMTTFFIIKSQTTIFVLGGTNYLDAVLCMQILMPIIIISGISNITGNQILIPFGKYSSFMKAVAIGAGADIILNAILMPFFLCVGAAIATLIAELIQMSIQLHYSKEKLKNIIDIRELIIIVLSTLISSILIAFLSSVIIIPAVIDLLVSAAIFGVVFIIIMVLFREKEMMGIIQILKTKVARLNNK